MQEVRLGDRLYRIGRMTPRTAIHVARRILPVVLGMVELIPFIEKYIARREEANSLLEMFTAEEISEMVSPLITAFSEMKQEDADFVMDRCLETVQVSMGGDRGWANLVSQGHLMFEDTSVGDQLKLVFRVIEENLGNFFPARGSDSIVAAQ